jgi:hypothetical protein
MKISYEFQGHDLTKFAESGGLPVWCFDPHNEEKFEEMLVAHTDKYYFLNYRDDSCVEDCLADKLEFSCKLRYTDPKDIMSEAPDWATHAQIKPSGRFTWREYRDEDLSVISNIQEVHGHLFDTTKYPEPIRIER